MIEAIHRRIIPSEAAKTRVTKNVISTFESATIDRLESAMVGHKSLKNLLFSCLLGKRIEVQIDRQYIDVTLAT